MTQRRCIIGLKRTDQIAAMSLFRQVVFLNWKKQQTKTTYNGDQLWVNNNFYW